MSYSLNKFWQWIWPIKKDESAIFFPMSILMFCILFNFSALRSIKDGLIVPGIGAEVISFLKFWIVLPSAVVCSLLYAKMSNLLKPEYIFYIIVSFFLFIILLFGFVIYPNESLFHPDSYVIEQYIKLYPHFKWQIKIIGKWSYAIIYVVGELWSGVVITLMFWHLANSQVTTEQASRLYPYFALIGNLGLVLSGMMMFFSTRNEVLALFMGEPAVNSNATLQLSACCITFFGLCAMLLYRRIALLSRVNKPSTEILKLSVKESMKLVVSSRYLWKILVIVISYGLAINLVEGPWKNKLSEIYPSTMEYINFMGRFNICMGFACVFFTICAGAILRLWDWFVGALMTPIMFAITGGPFFAFIVFSDHFRGWTLDPVFAAVIFGAIQNIMSKATKYSIFDATKEMAYIPLDNEMKTKGKAAVDIIGTKLGKSTGALIQFLMFSIYPGANFDSISSYLMIIFSIVIAVWIFAVYSLKDDYKAQLIRKQNQVN